VLHGQMAKKLLSTLLGGEKIHHPNQRRERPRSNARGEKVMDQTRRDREGNFRAQARKADVDYGNA
jgi:hypothetical protein